MPRGCAPVAASFTGGGLTGSGLPVGEALAVSLIVEQYARSRGTSEVAQLSQLLGQIGVAASDSGCDSALDAQQAGGIPTRRGKRLGPRLRGAHPAPAGAVHLRDQDRRVDVVLGRQRRQPNRQRFVASPVRLQLGSDTDWANAALGPTPPAKPAFDLTMAPSRTIG
jgi:hypothetical protein